LKLKGVSYVREGGRLMTEIRTAAFTEILARHRGKKKEKPGHDC